MQAILTKYLPPSNSGARGSRIKATCDAGSITIPWDYAVNEVENHGLACVALLTKLGWGMDTHGYFFPGCLPSGDYAWVSNLSHGIHSETVKP